MDTADANGFIENGDKYASGDDFEVEGRAAKLLRLTAGSQAQARHESWKKRQVQVPREERPVSSETSKAGHAKKAKAAPNETNA
jgi:hypothetical protein